jgi:hypothetical protein
MATKKFDTQIDESKAVRVTYPKSAPFEKCTLTGVGTFTRGANEFSGPMTPERANDLKRRKGFAIVTAEEYAAATSAKKGN